MRDEDFAQIKHELINEIKGMREDMTRLFETVQFHDQALYGDKKTVPGAMEEIRMLKTAEASRQKHIGWIWFAVIASVVERAFHYVAGK